MNFNEIYINSQVTEELIFFPIFSSIVMNSFLYYNTFGFILLWGMDI